MSKPFSVALPLLLAGTPTLPGCNFQGESTATHTDQELRASIKAYEEALERCKGQNSFVEAKKERTFSYKVVAPTKDTSASTVTIMEHSIGRRLLDTLPSVGKGSDTVPTGLDFSEGQPIPGNVRIYRFSTDSSTAASPISFNAVTHHGETQTNALILNSNTQFQTWLMEDLARIVPVLCIDDAPTPPPQGSKE